MSNEQLLVRAEENVEPARQEKVEADPALVELGKVSNTQGSFFGAKMDSGNGLVWT